MTYTFAVPTILEELQSIKLGDRRLDRRAQAVGDAISLAPRASFPSLALTPAELAATYNFFSNEDVHYQDILRPHVARTVERCKSAGIVFVAHDGTEFLFGGVREGLEEVSSDSSFAGHFSLAIFPGEERIPAGVLAVQPHLSERGAKGVLQRGRPKEKKSRSSRYKQPRDEKSSALWDRGIDAVEELFGSDTQLIHLCDREANDFALLAKVVVDQRRFVIRGSSDRAALWDDEKVTIHTVLEQQPFELFRDIEINERKKGTRGHPARSSRKCQLSVRAARVEIPAPQHAQTDVKSITVNVVEVRELQPPPHAEPVVWVLYTSEPIDSLEAITFVVDAYRARWTIEEFFKSLKTGCAYEERQLTHSHSLLNALSLLIPVAWRLLLIRTVGRSERGLEPASLVFTPFELKLLSTHPKSKPRLMSVSPTIRDVMFAVAALGGHLKNNGYPGWQTLAKGYLRLIEAAETYHLLIEADLDASEAPPRRRRGSTSMES